LCKISANPYGFAHLVGKFAQILHELWRFAAVDRVFQQNPAKAVSRQIVQIRPLEVLNRTLAELYPKRLLLDFGNAHSRPARDSRSSAEQPPDPRPRTDIREIRQEASTSAKGADRLMVVRFDVA
jgi:hypothetical protein